MGRTLNDSLTSMFTKLGEKSEAREYGPTKRLTPNYLWRLYETSWIVKKYIDKTAQDMTKKWREVQSNDFTAKELSEFTNLERKLEIKEVVEEALMWASLFGDSLILAITDVDDSSYILPLNLDTENIKRFIVIDRRAFKIGDVEDDITNDNFGNPKDYLINGDLTVHHTRVHRMRAGKQPLSEKTRSRYGTSDIQPLYKAIRQFESTSTSIDDLIEESNVDILKVEGLNDQVAAGNEDKVIDYARIAKKTKSSSNMLLIDKLNDYDQKQVNFAGLSDIWVKSGNVTAGALDMPITILFGQSASGFNSGEEDNKNYYDTISGRQESRLRPALDFTDQFIFDLMNRKPSDWWYEFPTIDTMNKKDQASIFTAYSTGLTALVSAAIISEAQALKELKQKAVFENVTDNDIREAEMLANEAGKDFRDNPPNSAAQSVIAAFQTQQAVRGMVP